jgi:hypothetical protein
MVPIGCCLLMRFLNRPNAREHARPEGNPSSHEQLRQQRAGRLRRMMCLLARHRQVDGGNQAVSQVVERRELLMLDWVFGRSW